MALKVPIKCEQNCVFLLINWSKADISGKNKLWPHLMRRPFVIKYLQWPNYPFPKRWIRSERDKSQVVFRQCCI